MRWIGWARLMAAAVMLDARDYVGVLWRRRSADPSRRVWWM